jgi:Flp pilus assembly pilin Flp
MGGPTFHQGDQPERGDRRKNRRYQYLETSGDRRLHPEFEGAGPAHCKRGGDRRQSWPGSGRKDRKPSPKVIVTTIPSGGNKWFRDRFLNEWPGMKTVLDFRKLAEAVTDRTRTLTGVEMMLRETFAEFMRQERGEDVAEYAVMLAVVAIIVIGTIRLIGVHAGAVISQVGSSMQ